MNAHLYRMRRDLSSSEPYFSRRRTMFTATRNHGAASALFGALAALSLAFAATASQAQPTVDTTRITVRYAELDVTKPAGAQALYRMIQQAAYQVCDGYVGRFSRMRTLESGCYKDAVANAVAAVGSPQLSAVHGARQTRVAGN
jgi:UrcA family protein